MIDVCHVITDSNLGGAGRWVQTLCRYLPRNRFRITVIFPQGSRLEEILKGERVCLCPAPVTADSSFCKKDLSTYCRLFAQLRPALVHTHGCATARLAAKLKGIPVVFTKHTVGSPMTGMNRWLNKKLCTKAIAVSDYAKESLERDGISPEKVELIYNACPDRGKIADREKAREEFQIPEGKLVVGMFARLSEEKGWQAMSRAICLVKEKRLPLFFLLAGGGRMEETLRQQLEGCPARMLGELADIGPALHACDAVCVPSLEESFGLTALEAMSASLPVVATRVGGLGEVLGEADELTVKPGDAESLLRALENLQDDPLRRKLGARGRKRYEKLFGPENFAMRVENLYREILDHKKKGGEK